jgi:hypothetical protein
MAADPFWRTTAEELAESGVGVNIFFFPDQYTDVASVGVLSSTTGGEIPKWIRCHEETLLFVGVVQRRIIPGLEFAEAECRKARQEETHNDGRTIRRQPSGSWVGSQGCTRWTRK